MREMLMRGDWVVDRLAGVGDGEGGADGMLAA